MRRTRLLDLLRLSIQRDIQQPFKDVDLGAVAVVVAATFVGVAAFALNKPDPARLQHFLPEHVELVRIVDSQPQRIAFYVFFAAMVIGSSVLPYLAGKLERLRPGREALLNILVTLGAAFVVIAAAMTLRQSLAGLMALAIAYAFSRHGRAVNMLWAGAAILVVLAIAPGFLGTPIINHSQAYYADTIRWSDFHYAAVLSQGERLAAGRLLFIDNDPAYGVLVPILIGLFSKFSHAPSFSELMRLVQVGQALCLIAFVTAAWLRTRGSPTAGRALAMFFVTLTIVPWLGNIGPAIWYPNQSGLRFFMLPVAVIIACLLEDTGPRAYGAVAGATAAISVLFNLETGIAITAGLGMGWLMRVRRESLSIATSSAVIGFVAVSATLGAIAAIYHLNFGGWPFPDSFESATANIRSIGGGFGGLKLPFNPLALLILVHAAYVFSRAFRSLIDSRSPPPDLTSAAIAAMLVAFFPYYVNRPDGWNLWIPTAMYSLLLAPMIAGQGRRFVPLTIAAFLVLPPSFMYVHRAFVEPLDRGRFIPGWEKGCADGLILPENLCQQLTERAATLKRMAAGGVVIWSTGLPMLTMRMSGLPGSFPANDIFYMTRTDAAFDDLMAKIRQLNPSAVLLDDPTDRVLEVLPAVHAFNTRLIHALGPNYCSASVTGGWRVVERSDRCAGTSWER